jgi:hypothetical protein
MESKRMVLKRENPRGGSSIGWFGLRAALVAAVFALVLTGCSSGNGGSDDEDDDDPAVPSPAGTVKKTLVYATAGTEANTQSLTLVFSADMGELKASDITLEALGGVNAGISKGSVSGSGASYTLEVGEITAEGEVRVSVKKNGAPVSGSPKTIWVHYGAQVVDFAYLEADGVSNTSKTKTLTLMFSSPGIPGLAVGEIRLHPHGTGNGSVSVKPGSLKGGPWVYTVGVEGIAEEGDVTVTIEKEHYTTSPRTVGVHYQTDPTGVFSNGNGTEGGSAIDLIKSAYREGLSSVAIQLVPGLEKVSFGADYDTGSGLVLRHTMDSDNNSPASVTIDGGGRTIDLIGNPTGNPLITVGAGVTLTLQNITFKGLKNGESGDSISNTAPLIKVTAGGHLIMKSGTISDNQSSYGGAGVVVSGGSFTMETGTISGNEAINYGGGGGGGVLVDNGGIFIMESGTISGNTARNGGGGVFVDNGSTFTMEGGAISGNTTSYGNGGGVLVDNGGTFTMKDGTISDNEAISYDGSGGGVYVGGISTFQMEGGTISRNICMGYDGGAGVFVFASATFSKTGGIIHGVPDHASFPSCPDANKSGLNGQGSGHVVAFRGYIPRGSNSSGSNSNTSIGIYRYRPGNYVHFNYYRNQTADESVNMTTDPQGSGYENWEVATQT